MSGGTYSYAYYRLEEFADEMASEGNCSAASPQLREAFRTHLRMVAEAMRAIEWNDSHDGDDREAGLLEACLKASEVVSEMERYLPVIERAESEPETWARLTNGTGLATANGYRAAIRRARAEK